MTKKLTKGTLLAALLGTAFQWGGCFGFGDTWWGRILWTAVGYAGLEFVLDNDGVFDLFEDGNVAA